jgi:hypothetical protein
LTAAPYQRQLKPAPRQASAGRVQVGQHSGAVRKSRAVPSYLLVGAFVLCLLAGVAAVVQAYQIAETTVSNVSEFAWFWIGILLIELPLAGLIVRRATAKNVRIALLTLYGLVSYLPKLLRNPGSPVYHDEFAHWVETYKIVSTGKLFQPNAIISIISQYPGLHAATAALVNFTGLTIWQSGLLLLIVFHAALVLGIYFLAQAMGFSNRTASLSALLYCLNSSFLYFDTQYAYESMAITLVVWTLIAYVRAIRSPVGGGLIGWCVLTVVLSAGGVITHHLSTFCLILIMLLISLALSVPWLLRGQDWTRPTATAWCLTLITALMAGAWFHFTAPSTLSYLSPYLGAGLSQLMQAATGAGSARQLFGASLSPPWEQKSAYLLVVFAIFLAAGGLLLIRAWIKRGRLPQGRRRTLVIAFGLLGLIYFPSTVFILSPSGAEGARRSWAFTWIGLSMLIGPAVIMLLDWTGRVVSRWKRVGLRAGLLTALAIALVGGTAAGLDASYRFPGPFLFGSDARSVSPELLAMSRWFTGQYGAGNKVVADRYTALIIDSYGLQRTAVASKGFPVYNLYLAKPEAAIEPAYLLFDLSLSKYTYLIVDARMAYNIPELGVYFTSNDPDSARPQGNRSPYYGRLAKFNTIQWAVKVFQSDNYSVYRLNLPPGGPGYRRQAPAPQAAPKRVTQGRLVVTP